MKRNPLSDLGKILRGGRYTMHNHLCKIWWQSVKGFSCGGDQILPLPIDFDRRPYNTLALSCEFVIRFGTNLRHAQFNFSRRKYPCWSSTRIFTATGAHHVGCSWTRQRPNSHGSAGSHVNMVKLSRDKCNLSVADAIIKPSPVGRDIAVLLDAKLTTKQHVNNVTRSCFFQLRRITRLYGVASTTTQPCSWSVVWTTAILSYLDCQSRKILILQPVQNPAARLVAGLRPHDHITQALKDLHWLPVEFRIKYKVCLLMHILASSLHIWRTPWFRDSNSCTGLRLGSTQRYRVRQ